MNWYIYIYFLYAYKKGDYKLDFKNLKYKLTGKLSGFTKLIEDKGGDFKSYIRPKINRRNIAISIISAIIIVGAISFSYVYYGSSKSNFLNKFEKVLLGDDPYKALKYMKLKGKGALDNKTGEPLMEFIKENKDRGNDFIKQLRYGDNNENDILRLREKKGLILTSYYVEVKDVYINLSTNLKETEIFFNGESFYRVKENDFSQKFGPLVPGLYDIKGVYRGKYGDIENSAKVLVLSKEESVNIPLKGQYVTLDGNYRDSKIYLNGVDTQKTIAEFKEIGPIPATSKVYASRKFPWSDNEIKSEEKQIEDHSKLILNIDPMTEDVRKSLEDTYREFYKGFFEALSNEDKGYIKNTTESIKSNLYETYNKKSRMVSNSYSMDGLKWQKDAISIEKKDGSFKSRAIADIRYKEKTSLFVFNLSEVEVKKSFDTELTYDEEQSKWVVTSVKEINASPKK